MAALRGPSLARRQAFLSHVGSVLPSGPRHRSQLWTKAGGGMARRPVFPSDFRALFRVMARCAVASSFGVAVGCATSHRQPAPDEPPDESMGQMQSDAAMMQMHEPPDGMQMQPERP